MGMLENLKRGVTELVLLNLLTQGDNYGYEMAQEIKARSSGRFTLIETAMYPVLYRMQDNGYISSYEKPAGLRRKRTYYHLEPAGREYYETCLREYTSAQQGIQAILAYNKTDEAEADTK